MKKLKELILIKLILIKRGSYEKKENISFIYITFAISIIMSYFYYIEQNELLNLTSSYLIVGSVYYQNTNDRSFLSFVSLALITNRKKNCFYYNLLGEIIIKTGVVSILLFVAMFNSSLYFVLFFLFSNSLFIITCYLMAELSIKDKLGYYLFRGWLFFVLSAFIEIFNSILLKQESILGKVICSHPYKYALIFTFFLLITIFVLLIFFLKKSYFR